MLASIFLMLAGCEPPLGWGPGVNPAALTDSTGVVFDWSCDDDGCQLGLQPDTLPPPGCDYLQSPGLTQPGYQGTWERFFAICAGCRSELPVDLGESAFLDWRSPIGWCRPAACETRSDCPQLIDYPESYNYDCRNGLCQNINAPGYPAGGLNPMDLHRLCFAKYPRCVTADPSNSTTAQIIDLIAESCTGDIYDCSLPEECWQP